MFFKPKLKRICLTFALTAVTAMQKRYEEDVETIALHTQETKEKSSVDADGIAFKKGKER